MARLVFGTHGSFDAATGCVVLPPGETRCEADYWPERVKHGQSWRLDLKAQVHEAPAGCEFILAQLHAQMEAREAFGPAVALWRTRDGIYRIQISHHAGTPFVRANVVEVDVAAGIDLSRPRAISIGGRFSPDERGTVTVWVDGAQAGSYAGPLGYADARSYYARAGVYCWEERSGRIMATVKSQWTALQ